MSIETKLTYLKGNHYSFDLMEEQINQLIKHYPFLDKRIIGKSVQGRSLYCLTLGHGNRKVHINGSHHGNEWITSLVIMRSIELFCEGIQNKKLGTGMDTTCFLEKCSYDFVPMVNPDGVELCVCGVQDATQREVYQKLNEDSLAFARWKANARGVDLNRNYNAGFEAYRQISEQQEPGYGYYQGEAPESEPETQALARLTEERDYDMVLAYHTQGEVIYWTYRDIFVANAKEYAKMFSKASGYMLDFPEAQAASGGYKDWFIERFKKPGFTIECGLGENPLPIDQLDTILTNTFPILLLASKDLRKEE